MEKLLALACADAPSGSLALPGNMRARRDYGRMIFEHKTDLPEAFEPFRLEDGLSRTAAGYYIEAKREKNRDFVDNSLNTFYIKYDIIKNGVFVRPRREGDRFRLSKRGVSKSLKKLFIEAKIPVSLRTNVPVLSSGEDIVAVAGFGMDECFKAGLHEDSLRVEICRL
jgi:tRNA(Ile)-lysidine synthase